MKLKKVLAFCMALLVSVFMAGCGGGGQSASSGGSGEASHKGVKIGVSMPTKSFQRWNEDGANME